MTLETESTRSESVSRLEAGEEDVAEEETEQLLPNTTIVTHCIYKNDPQRLVKCFEDDTDPYKEEIADLLNERDDDGKSPLDLAACLGRVELTKELLQRGADINDYTEKGYSCLHYAAAWGRLGVLKVQIENNGSLQQKNINNERARETAMRYGQMECVDYLDWAEAKALLQETIRSTQETILEADKTTAGRITKEERVISLNSCKEKQEWLDTTPDATTQDFVSNRSALMDIVVPVLQKLNEPPPAKDANARPKSKTRPKSGIRSLSGSRPSSEARPKSGKKTGGPMFNPQKGKKKGK